MDKLEAGLAALVLKRFNEQVHQISASQRLVHRPARKETTARTKDMVRVGYPSSELAFNHAIECLEMFGIGFTSDQVKVAGKRAAEALADAAYYLCSLVPTIGRRTPSILPVLAELGFFFLPATGAVAMAILSDPGAYNDKLDNGTYTLRVGEDAAAAPKEYYLFRYFTPKEYYLFRPPRPGGAGPSKPQDYKSIQIIKKNQKFMSFITFGLVLIDCHCLSTALGWSDA